MWRTKTPQTNAQQPTTAPETRAHDQQPRRGRPQWLTRLRTLYVIGFAALAMPLFGISACSEDFSEIDEPTTESAAGTTAVAQPLVTVTEVEGNPTCAELVPGTEELRIDESEIVEGGTYTSDDGYLTVTITDYNGLTFSFTSDEGVDAVFVKGGPGGILYEYDPETTSGDNLTAVRDGTNYEISHLSFCYDVEFARISIEPDDVNEVGDEHTFTVTVEQKIGFDGEWMPVDEGTIVDVSFTDQYGAVTEVVSDTCADPGTDALGQCTVTIVSDSAGTITAHAEASPEIGNSTVNVETDGEGENSDDAVKRYVDADLDITPPSDTNSIGEEHTFTVTATVDEGQGDGPQPVPEGTIIDVEFDPDTTTVVEDTCATGTTGTTGTCTVTIVSNTAGTITATASMDLLVDGSPEIETDLTLTRQDTATKTYVDGALTWRKIDGDTQELLGGATFELCRTHDWNSETMSYDPVLPEPDCVSVTDNGPLDADPDAGEFLVEDLVLGRYTLRETAAPMDYEFDETDIRTADLSTTTLSYHFGDFLNFPEDEDPPEEFSGCTPGFWKNHTELWDDASDPIAMAAGFTTETDFHDFFNLTPEQTGLPDGLTMEDAINLGGGGPAKLARHAVAALLNSATEFDYDYDGDLYEDIRQAFLNDTEEALGDILDQANNFGCLVD